MEKKRKKKSTFGTFYQMSPGNVEQSIERFNNSVQDGGMKTICAEDLELREDNNSLTPQERQELKNLINTANDIDAITSYINAKAEVTIKKYLESRKDDNEYLFVSKRAPHNPLSVKTIEDIIKKIMKKCPDIHKTVTPHIFRHTTATIALQNGMPIENVSKLLGHSQVSTTQIYAETSDDNIALDHKKYVI